MVDVQVLLLEKAEQQVEEVTQPCRLAELVEKEHLLTTLEAPLHTGMAAQADTLIQVFPAVVVAQILEMVAVADLLQRAPNHKENSEAQVARD
jgi:hypothetical protein